ncbi:MAG: hypothetical protein NXI22_07785 [bacterium]|nr:hypothetical protein [bacterium]
MTVLKVAGISLTRLRIPQQQGKRRLLRVFGIARVHFPLQTVLRAIWLTNGR